jgi:hypothetical protein
MRTPLTVAAVAATGLLLVGGGTALALGHGGPDEQTPVTALPVAAIAPAVPGGPAPTTGVVPPELPVPAAERAPAGAAVDRAAAERTALDAAGAGRVTDAEFDRAGDDRDDDRDDRDDRHDDRDHWEIEIRDGGTEHDIDVDAATGAVLDHDVDHDDRDDRHDDSDDS